MSLKDTAEHLAQTMHIKAETAAPATSYVTNGIVFTWGALTFNQIMMLIGTAFAILTYFTSLYFQRKRDRREQEYHRHRLWMEERMKAQDKSGDAINEATE